MLGKGNQDPFSGVGDTDCPEEPGSVFRSGWYWLPRGPSLRTGFLLDSTCMVVWFVQRYKVKQARLGLIGPGLWSQRTTFSFCSWSVFQFLLLQDPQRFPWLPLQELVAYVLSTHVPALLFCSVSSWCQGWAQFFSSVFLSSRITHCSYLAKMSRRLKIDMLLGISFKKVFLAKIKNKKNMP